MSGAGVRLDVETPAVVLKLDRNIFHHGGLGVIRSLGRLGVPVYRVHEDRLAPAAGSRYLCGRAIGVPDPARRPVPGVPRCRRDVNVASGTGVLSRTLVGHLVAVSGRDVTVREGAFPGGPGGTVRSPAQSWQQADITRAAADLGWRPRRDLTDAVRDIWARHMGRPVRMSVLKGAARGAPRLVVPAYFHPAVRPGDWEWLAARPGLVRFVVLNVASGPGHVPQPEFEAVAGRLAAAGTGVLGYVDTAYGHRDPRQVATDIRRYLDWYPVSGVCMDRAAAEPARLAHYALLAGRARAMGAATVFFNHGTHPAEGYASHADLLGVFEGPWHAYRRLRPPAWTRDWPATMFYHVVHSVPPEEAAATWRLAVRHRAGSAYVTERSGPNPYDALPALLTSPGAHAGNGAPA